MKNFSNINFAEIAGTLFTENLYLQNFSWNEVAKCMCVERVFKKTIIEIFGIFSGWIFYKGNW